MTTPLRNDFPLNLGRIIRAEDVIIMQPPQAEAATLHDTPKVSADVGVSCQQPEIMLVKDGDRVKTIVIKCTCGQVISLDCEY